MILWLQVLEMAEFVRSKVQEGYIVRARADADTVEARSNFTARWATKAARDSVLSHFAVLSHCAIMSMVAGLAG